MTRNDRQRSDADRPLDLLDQRQPGGIVVGDRNLVLAHDPQVFLDQPKHVEVLAEARRGVQPLERLGHSLRHRS